MAILADELTRNIRLESKQHPPDQSGRRLGNTRRSRDTRRDAQTRPQRGAEQSTIAPRSCGKQSTNPHASGRTRAPDGHARRAGRRYAAENKPERIRDTTQPPAASLRPPSASLRPKPRTTQPDRSLLSNQTSLTL